MCFAPQHADPTAIELNWCEENELSSPDDIVDRLAKLWEAAPDLNALVELRGFFPGLEQIIKKNGENPHRFAVSVVDVPQFSPSDKDHLDADQENLLKAAHVTLMIDDGSELAKGTKAQLQR